MEPPVDDGGGLHPGPVDPSLLYLQNDHRSSDIWETQDESTLICRRGGLTLFRDANPLHPRVIECLREAGFYGAYRLGYFELDHSLITAMVERWRVETHSFHLPCGESTITLQDMGVMIGLRVDGGAITGRDLDKGEAVALCTRLLGRAPPEGRPYWTGLQVSLSWLAGIFAELPEDATDEVVRCHTRAVIMFMLGSYLMPNKKGTHVPIHPLQLLEDIPACSQLAWGAGTLAYLYRELCRATAPGVREVSGCLLLVQLWAWERLACVRPKIIDGAQLRGQSHPEDPRGRRWACHTINVIQHNLRHYRDQLDHMTEDQMTWEPYSADILDSLPSYCKEGQSIWCARVPLIYFDIVEMHLPDRVLRQFGLRQKVPINCDTGASLHSTDRRGREKYDWRVAHAAQIALWDSRRMHVVSGEACSDRMGHMDLYMVWFRQITRLIIQRPHPRTDDGFRQFAGINSLLVQALARIYNIVQHEPDEPWRRVRDICIDTAKRTFGEERLLEVPPSGLVLPSASSLGGLRVKHPGVVLRPPKRVTARRPSRKSRYLGSVAQIEAAPTGNVGSAEQGSSALPAPPQGPTLELPVVLHTSPVELTQTSQVEEVTTGTKSPTPGDVTGVGEYHDNTRLHDSEPIDEGVTQVVANEVQQGEIIPTGGHARAPDVNGAKINRKVRKRALVDITQSSQLDKASMDTNSPTPDLRMHDSEPAEEEVVSPVTQEVGDNVPEVEAIPTGDRPHAPGGVTQAKTKRSGRKRGLPELDMSEYLGKRVPKARRSRI